MSIQHLTAIDIYNRVPMLNMDQQEMSFNLTVSKPGQYVMLINYITPLDDLRTHKVGVVVHSGSGEVGGGVILYSCPYTASCRQVVTNEEAGVGVFTVEANSLIVDLKVPIDNRDVLQEIFRNVLIAEQLKQRGHSLDLPDPISRLVVGLYQAEAGLHQEERRMHRVLLQKPAGDEKNTI